jgi:hypothetical protein
MGDGIGSGWCGLGATRCRRTPWDVAESERPVPAPVAQSYVANLRRLLVDLAGQDERIRMRLSRQANDRILTWSGASNVDWLRKSILAR